MSNSRSFLILDTPKSSGNRKEDKSVQYYNHFRKDFLRPYGLAHEESSFDDATITRRLNSYNCEFYLRPQVAISEFAETVQQNLHYIRDNAEIIDQRAISAFVKKTEKLEPYLAILDTKQSQVTGMGI